MTAGDDDAVRAAPGSSGATGRTPGLETGGLYALLVESVRDYAIFALDARGYIVSWNRGAQLIIGYGANEIIGRHFSAFYLPEEIAAGKPAWELEVAARDGRLEDEGWRLRADGTRFWTNVVITALRDESGALVGFAKVTRDLTERKAAENALRESEKRLALIVQSVKDYGIFMLTPEGNVATWNDGARRIKGYEASEIIGRHFSTFYPEVDIAWGKPPWELEVATQEGRFEDEGWRVRKDGSLFWANVVITALRDETGELVGFAKVTRDLTERKAAEQRAIDDARRVAESDVANRAKSEFLAAMSHELRTPLNAIGGYAELIEMGIVGPVSEQQRDYLTRIRHSQQHLLGIITNLLNYSRIEAGQMAYDVTTMSVESIVRSVLPLIEPQAVAKRLRVEAVPCDATLVVEADRTKAEQVVLNLLSNAVKFTPPGGTVTVECAGVDDGRVAIRVRDTGPGIANDRQEAIFEPFVQLGRSLANPHEGTGLGLAISRDLARAMRGDVTVTSAPGRGSEFVLTLPTPAPVA